MPERRKPAIFFATTPYQRENSDRRAKKGMMLGFHEDLEALTISGAVAYRVDATIAAGTLTQLLAVQYTSATVAIPISATMTAGPTGSKAERTRNGIMK